MKMLIPGDISPTGVNAHLFREQNTEALFGNTLPIFENKDFIFANLECEAHIDVWRELYPTYNLTNEKE